MPTDIDNELKATPTPLRGKALAVAVINHIIGHPEEWDQFHWHCNTRHCFGGWCQIMGGRPMVRDCVVDDVEELLGVDDAESYEVCHASNSFAKLYRFVRDMDGNIPRSIHPADFKPL